MDKTNCFANVSANVCFAMKIKDCKHCSFYKPANNPDMVRGKIIAECLAYEKRHRGY